MQLSGQVLEDAAVYFRICISFSFFQALISAISAVFRSYGLPKIAVWVSLFMNFLNAVLNIIVIFRPFETPLHGVHGIAVTNVISHAAAFILIVICLLKSSLELNFRKFCISAFRAESARSPIPPPRWYPLPSWRFWERQPYPQKYISPPSFSMCMSSVCPWGWPPPLSSAG